MATEPSSIELTPMPVELVVRHAVDDSPAYLAFSDGTLISYSYGLAGWCFDIARKGSAEVRVVKSDPAGDYSYDVRTDRVEIDGDITWVLHGSEVAK